MSGPTRLLQEAAEATTKAVAKRPTAIERLGVKADEMGPKAGNVIDAEFSVMPKSLELPTGKAAPLSLPAKAEGPKLTADKLFKDLYVTETEKIAGRMGMTTKTSEMLNPQFKAAVESGDATLPPGVRINESGELVEKISSRGGTSEAPVSASKRNSILKRTVVGGGLAAAAGTAAVMGGGEGEPPGPTSLAQLTPDEGAQPVDVQLQLKAKEVAGARNKALGGGSGAGVAGEAKIRTAMGIEAIPMTKRINALIAEADQLKNGLTSTQKDWYEEKLTNVRTQTQIVLDRVEDLKKEAINENNATDMYLALGQSMELIGQNLVRLYAANYGLKKGVDLSGLKFDRFDWQSTQARYDKRFERLMNSLDEQQEKATSQEAVTTQKIISEASDTERANISKAASLMEKAADVEMADVKNQMSAQEKKAEFAQKGEIEQAKLDLDQERLDLMRERNADMREAKATGKLDKAKALEDKLRLEAVRKLKAGIAAEAATDNKIDEKQMKSIIAKASEELSKADVDLNAILPDITSTGFLGFGGGKVDKAALLEKLDGLQATQKTGASNPEILYSESADEIPSLLD